MRIAHNRLNFLRNATKGHDMKTIEIIEFTQEQDKTVKLAFNAEHLKDEITLSKLFDEYDFDSLDDEDN